MKPQLTSFPKHVNLINLSWVLTINELKRNYLSYLIPLPFILILLIISIFLNRPIYLGVAETLSFTGILVILALTYGLQCFSSDSDKKTLDFMISRPIPPLLILIIKYLVSIIILMIWYILSLHLIRLNIAQLPLPKGIGIEWLTLIIIAVHAISLFSGLLAKGLERFFVVIIVTIGITYANYYIWSQIFNLITANYYWFDIPDYQMNFIRTILPYYLTIISLLLPFTGTLWLLRNRIPLLKFTPGKIVLTIWILSFMFTIFAQSLFAPVLWPQKTARYGDWNEKAGIVIAGPVDSSYEFSKLPKDKMIKWQLSLSKPGHKPHVFYCGYNLGPPRFAPDGKKLLVSEAGTLKIITIKCKKIINIGKGNIGTWSKDSTQIIYNRSIGPYGKSELYRFDLLTGKTIKINIAPLNIADLIWNSTGKELYIVDYDQSIHILNLKTLAISSFPFEDDDKLHIIFGITHPLVRLDPERENLLLGYINQNSLKIYLFNLNSKQFHWNEEISNFRLKTGAPVILKPDFSVLLWPRIDGTFNYQATQIFNEKQHALAHKHGHNHEHEHEDEE